MIRLLFALAVAAFVLSLPIANDLGARLRERRGAEGHRSAGSLNRQGRAVELRHREAVEELARSEFHLAQEVHRELLAKR